MSKLAGASVVVIALLIAVVAASGQAGPASSSGQNGDVLQALLREVRQLRVALETAASTQATIHLVVQRANVQEERLWRISREVDAIRTEIGNTSNEATRLASDAKRMEDELGNISDAAQRREVELGIADAKRQAASLQQKEQGLRQRENGMAQTLQAEEARWGELNQRLDDLERRLVQPKP